MQPARVVLVAACGLTSTCSPDNSLQRFADGDRLRIGYAVEAPYAFVVGSGHITGESPELARVIAGRLGVNDVAWRQIGFARLIDELLAGTIDVVAAGMFITPERAKAVAFSAPTMQVRAGLLVQRGNPHRLDSYQSAIAQAPGRIAALENSVEQSTLSDLGLPRERLLLVPDAVAGRAAVETGTALALALSQPTLRWMVHGGQLGATEVATPFTPPPHSLVHGHVAFVFRKQDAALRQAWDDALRGYVGSEAHVALLDRFGLGPTELPSFATAEEVLRAW